MDRRDARVLEVLCSLALSSVLLLGTSCSRSHTNSESEDYLSQALANLPNLPSFHATLEGQIPYATARIDYLYQSPDSWKIKSADDWLGDVIVVGTRVWEYLNDHWVRTDDPAKLMVLESFRDSLQRLRASSTSNKADTLGPGPTTFGENTRLFKVSNPHLGDLVVEELQKVSGVQNPSAVTALKELYRDVRLDAQVLIGNNSRLIYQIQIQLKGPNYSGQETFKFDYPAGIHIEEPK